MLETESFGDKSRSYCCIEKVHFAVTPPRKRYLRSDSLSSSIFRTSPFHRTTSYMWNPPSESHVSSLSQSSLSYYRYLTQLAFLLLHIRSTCPSFKPRQDLRNSLQCEGAVASAGRERFGAPARTFAAHAERGISTVCTVEKAPKVDPEALLRRQQHEQHVRKSRAPPRSTIQIHRPLLSLTLTSTTSVHRCLV